MIENCVKSHIGQRDVNEDHYLIDEELGLFIVADGVGGLDKGEVASKLTCQLIQQSIKKGMDLVAAIEFAHQSILLELRNKAQNKGMATTVVAIKFDQSNYEIAWVGDSRVYLWDGELKLLTRDHSYLELLYVSGHIGIEEFKDHPNKNVISQAIGIERKDITVSVNKGTLEKNQRLLMATDGLYEVVNEQKIIEMLAFNHSIEKLTNDLVNSAVNLEGKDNITLLTLKNNAEVLEKNVIHADVVRKFNANTGIATEIKDDLKKQSDDIKKVVTKSIMPQDLSLDKTKNDSQSKFKFKPLEWFLIVLIIIAILVILKIIL